MTNNLQPGMKVRTVLGQWVTILRFEGTSVYTCELTYVVHITKILCATAYRPQ